MAMNPGDVVGMTRLPDAHPTIGTVADTLGTDNLIVRFPVGPARLCPTADAVPIWAASDVRALLGVHYMTSTAEDQFVIAVLEHHADLTEAAAEDYRRRVIDAVSRARRKFLTFDALIRWTPEQTPIVVVRGLPRARDTNSFAVELIWDTASGDDFLRRELRTPVADGIEPLPPCAGRHLGKASSRPEDRRGRAKRRGK